MQKPTVVQSVEISTIAHATDDLDKVQKAVESILPGVLRDRQAFSRRYVEGHHRNPIVTFDTRLSKPADVEAFMDSFFKQLSRTERQAISRQLHLYADEEGNLYLRVNKQGALLGVIELGEEEPIRIRMKFSRLHGDPTAQMKGILESE